MKLHRTVVCAVLLLAGCVSHGKPQLVQAVDITGEEQLTKYPLLLQDFRDNQAVAKDYASTQQKQGFAVMTPPLPTLATTKMGLGNLFVLHYSGPAFCGSTGCASDFYLEKYGSLTKIANISHEIPFYQLDCGWENYLLFDNDAGGYSVWSASRTGMNHLPDPVKLESEDICSDIDQNTSKK